METGRKLSVCVETNIGRKRTNNEDAYQIVYGGELGCDVESFGSLFAVADGMGGYAGGEVASKIASEGLLEYYAGKLETGKSLDPIALRLGRLEATIWKSDKKISRLAEEMPEYANMGTTLSVLVLFEGFALIAHVGDSRIYRLRNGSLEQLTRDETMAQLSVDMGYLKPDDVPGHHQGHILVQALGVGLKEINTRIEKVEMGDVYLLCSDGLYDMVPDKQIHEIIHDSTIGQEVCGRLVEAALHGGGIDNVTVILVGVE